MSISTTKTITVILFVVLAARTRVSCDHIRTKRQAVPQTVDYARSGLTTPVKNQGLCDSGYAFAVAAAIEGQAMKTMGIRKDLSSQQIIDCSGSYGNLGCDGGFPSAAFDYVRDAGGLTSFSAYPFTSQVGQCKYDNPIMTVSGHRRYVKLTPAKLRQIVYSVGPVVVSIDASAPELTQYSGGILRTSRCKGYFRIAEDADCGISLDVYAPGA